MPGANYFLSQVAAQTPGPLLGAIVPPKVSSPSPCFQYISTPQEEPYISVIGTKTSTCRDVATPSPKPMQVHPMSAYRNGSPKPRYNQTYSPSPPPLSPSVSNLSTKPPQPLKPPGKPPNPPGGGTALLPNVRKQDNPVGELQELCTKMRWVFPTYYIYCDEAQPHERAFCVVVRLYRFREKGEAKSKRAAKREAATRVLNRLRNWPADVPIQQFSNQNAAPQCSKPAGLELSHFKASQVQVTPPPSYYINELSMLCQKHSFAAVYVKIDESSAAGEVQFVLQLSTCPVIVVKGSGRSLFLAKAEAAKGALDCLRIMCKAYFTRPPKM